MSLYGQCVKMNIGNEFIFRENPWTKDLGLISDILRYIFTWAPCFPQTRAFMTLLKIQELNNQCHNNVPEDSLESICGRFAEDPYFLYHNQYNYEYLGACCQVPYIKNEAHAVCGETLTFINPDHNNDTETIKVTDCNTPKGKRDTYILKSLSRIIRIRTLLVLV